MIPIDRLASLETVKSPGGLREKSEQQVWRLEKGVGGGLDSIRTK